jgi:hypothetical protein
MAKLQQGTQACGRFDTNDWRELNPWDKCCWEGFPGARRAALCAVAETAAIHRQAHLAAQVLERFDSGCRDRGIEGLCSDRLSADSCGSAPEGGLEVDLTVGDGDSA